MQLVSAGKIVVFVLLLLVIFLCALVFNYDIFTFQNVDNAFTINSLTSSQNINENSPAVSDKKYVCEAPHLAITVSPLPDRYLQLYWRIEYVVDSGDWIALFDRDPNSVSSNETRPLFTSSVPSRNGVVNTNITAAVTPAKILGFRTRCLGYWAAYFHRGTIVASSCLQTNPTWMSDMRVDLEHVKLKHVFLPGTHDSCAYTAYQPDLVRNYLLEKYVYTQDEDVLSQLIYGVRYLDLRISSYNETADNGERWWINHNVFKLHPLRNILRDVKTFLQNSDDIIILDFHEFIVGFDDLDTHRELVYFIRSELNKWISYPSWSATCGYFWRTNKKLVISYNNLQVRNEFPSILWLPVVHMWPNVQKIDDLEKYLSKVIKSRPSSSWAAMAELTANAWTILTRQNSGLREMANSVNPFVTKWFEEDWGRMCNIVAVDYLRGTDIVNVAIKWNRRRSRKTSCD